RHFPWRRRPRLLRRTCEFVMAGDDAERSDEEERRYGGAGDDAERSDEVGAPPACGGERRYGGAGDDAERSDEEERRG
ncbi:MAG: hypothetical protein ACLPRW_27715, partial [Mycobacterium sp.]